MLVFDWGEIGPLFVFCAVMAWSRVRFVYFADNLGAEATMTALARCFEYLGAVPKTALTDRMGCLKGGTVAGLVVPTPAYVRFATHYGFRPDFCEGADPESKGLVENLVGYVKSDLMIPEELSVADLAGANEKGLAWCDEVNAVVHSEICADPRRATGQRARGDGDAAVSCGPPSASSSCARSTGSAVCASARPATRCPTIHIGRQVELGGPRRQGPDHLLGRDHRRPTTSSPLVRRPFSTSTTAGPGPCPPVRCGPRPPPRRPSAPSARWPSPSSRGRPPGGSTSLKGDLDELAQMEAAHGKEVLLAALERAAAFGRFRAHDVRSIIAAGTGVPRPAAPGEALIVELPLVPTRSLSDYAIGERVMSTTPPALPADIEAGLRRLRLRAMRSLSPELLVTAKTQRWKPEEFLRTLVEAEIASRDASNAGQPAQGGRLPGHQDARRVRRRVPRRSNRRPSTTSRASSGCGPRRTSAWSARPARARATCSSPSVTRAIEAGFRVRYFTAVELVETLYRGLADNSVGRVSRRSSKPT